MTIKHRKFARERFAGQQDNSTHRIKMGTTLTTVKDGRSVSYPSPTNGFYIVRNTMVGDSFVIDYDLMALLGFKNREKIDEAIKLGRNAKHGSLPMRIEFMILNDAARSDGGWRFPGLIDEEYQAWHTKGIVDPEWKKAGQTECQGMFCRGNGDTCERKMPDGTTRTGECNPYGKAGVDPAKFCPYSRPNNSPCRSRFTLTLALCRNDKDGLKPLSNAHESRFRMDTGSEANAMRILGELENAADQLDGRISGLYGTLCYQLLKKVKPAGADTRGGKSGLTPQVTLTLNQWQIEERIRAMRQQGRLLEAPAPRRQIAGMAATVETGGVTVAQPASPPVAEPDEDWYETEDSNPPSEGDGPSDPGPASAGPEGPVFDSKPDFGTPVAEATMRQLEDALLSYVMNVTRDEDAKDSGEVMKRITRIEGERDGRPTSFATDNINVFGELGERGEKALRTICQRIVEKGDIRFYVMPEVKP
jgi:hypothetical protein